MAKKIQMMSHDKEWQVVDGVETLVPVEQFDIDPVTDSSCVKIEGFRTLEETLNEKNMFTPEVSATKVMDKVGGEYHQNVVDGAYEEAILYGNTQVNLCEEDSSDALQIPTTFTSFNNSELQINNKESQVVAPLIKGVTMVNLAQINSGSVTSGNGIPIQNVKGNTVYTLSFTFTTKNANSGVTIQCYDGNGAFIENTMHKTGLGDVAKFTFTTHANTAKIHICNNAAYGGETIQLDEIMLIEGDQTALDIPFFKGMKSVELVRPLTNLFTDTTPSILGGVTVTNSNGTVVATSVAIDRYRSVQYKPEFKANTDYVVIWDTLTYTHTVTSDDTVCVCKNDTVIANSATSPSIFKNRSIKFNTGGEPSTITLRIHATLGNTETGKTTVTGLRVFEYDDYLRSVDLQSIGWFSGTKNVAVEPIKTCSKNLYPYGDVNFTSEVADAWCDAKGNAHIVGDVASKSKSRFLLKKGTYCYSHGGATNVSGLQIVDDKENLLLNPIRLEQDTYCTLRVKTIEANVATTVTNIQIERGSTETDYVAHDSRYYEPNGQNAIVLRSLPNEVCDTFNLQTGEYTRRIGEVVLNGSEEWRFNKPLGDGSFNQFVVNRVQAKKIVHQEVVCDRLISKVEETVNNVIWIYDGTTIVIQSSCTSVDELKTWLQQNPLTVQYEFRESSTTIIPRAIKRNNNGTISTIDFGTYTNKESLVLPKNPSYLTINSMTSIKPVVEPITYLDFKTRLKANTDYSVIIDKDSINKTINLGGTSKTYIDKMLVRTPSINLEQNLRISGSGSIQNIMVIEGDVLDKELPYFNGMCNVKMPIVRNCGKNLFDGELYINYGININGTTSGEPAIPGLGTITDWVTTKNHMPVKKGDIISIAIDANDSDITSNRRYTYVYKYDARKQFIVNERYDLGINTKTFTVAHNGYIRCTIRTHNVNNISITKENTPSMEQYRSNDICLAQSEIGLSQDMFEQGGFSGDSGNTYDNCKANTNTNIRMRTKGLITVKPNTTYIVNNNTSPNMNHVFYLFDESQKYLGSNITVNAKSFVTPNNCRYVSLMFSKNSNANISVSEFKQELFQLLELDSTVQLRSLPNGVKDEINLLTGEYIQRIDEVVLDGSQNVVSWWNTTSTIGVSISIPTMKNISDLVCDRLPVMYYGDINNDTYDTEGIASWDSGNVVRFRILKSKLTTEDVDGVVSYLQQNPVTVQYELAQPIISYPRIVSNTQEREVGVKLPNGICDTYNPSTGITVKRVGFIELDGSENISLGTDGTYTNTTEFYIDKDLSAMKPKNNDSGILYCNKLTYAFSNNDMEHYYTVYNGGTLSKGRVVVFIQQSKLTSQDAAGLKTYLSQNPIKIWYELKNPIVTTDIVLPNGVHDEYNPLTGLYTKRVEYIELDGGETNLNYRVHSNGYLLVDITGIKTASSQTQPTNNILSNVSVRSVDDVYSNTNITTTSIALHHQAKSLMVRAINNSTTATNVDEYKQYLSQNPIKLWYELQTPITYQLTPYFGLPMPYAYKDGYLIMDSAYEGQTLPPEIKYKLLTNRTGQITQNNVKLQNHTSKLSNLEAMLVEATLQSMYEREMMAFNLEMVNINLINLEE